MILSVHNSDELREAVAITPRLNSCTIVLFDDVILDDTLHIPQSKCYLDIVSPHESVARTIDMKGIVFRGYDAPRRNGIESRCEQLLLRNVELMGYDDSGAALRHHGAGDLILLGVAAREIGKGRYPYRNDNPQTAADSCYNSVFACTRLMQGRIIMQDCAVMDSIHGDATWSHVLYLSALRTSITNCYFSGCGNVFGVGGNVPGAKNLIAHNTIKNPHKQVHHDWLFKQGVAEVPPYLIGLGGDELTFCYNTVEGLHIGPAIKGRIDRTAQHFFGNDYSRMTYSSHWSADTSNGIRNVWDGWRAWGMDFNSLPPQHLGDRIVT